MPTPDEEAARAKFSELIDEARRWKGPPARVEEQSDRRLNARPDLAIRQAGRGLLVRARMAQFGDWWNDERTWAGDPMGRMFDWIAES